MQGSAAFSAFGVKLVQTSGLLFVRIDSFVLVSENKINCFRSLARSLEKSKEKAGRLGDVVGSRYLYRHNENSG
jgi:hypothetical protein